MNKIRNYLNWIAAIFANVFIIGLFLRYNNLYLIGILIFLFLWGLEILQFKLEQKEIRSNKLQIFQEKYNMSNFLSVVTILIAIILPLIHWLYDEITIKSLFTSIMFLIIGFRSLFFPNQSGRLVIISDKGLSFGFMNRFIAWDNILSFEYESSEKILNMDLKSGFWKKAHIDLGLYGDRETILKLIESKQKTKVV